MNIRDLQNQIEIIYGLRGHTPKDGELTRVLGLAVSTGKILEPLYHNLVHELPVSEMRAEIQEEVVNNISMIMAVCSYYDIDYGECLQEVQDRTIKLLEDYND